MSLRIPVVIPMFHARESYHVAAASHVARSGPYRLRRRPEERIHLLGGAMDFVKAPEVFHFVRGQIETGQSAIIGNHNLHSLYLLRRDARFREFYSQADLIEVDSIPLIFWAKLVGRRGRRFHRCTYLDWRNDFWAMISDHGWRVFFLGGEQAAGDEASSVLKAAWPGINLRTHHGYFDASDDSAENVEVLGAINDFAPHILLVGMGMPRQEIWVAQNARHLRDCVIFTVGGAFDYEAGVQQSAPRWLGQLGAEWLFRLVSNPTRMFERYCIEPWALLPLAIHDIASALASWLSGDRARHESRHTSGRAKPVRR